MPKEKPMKHIVKILSVQQVTHDVRRYQLEKPAGYTFVPGQATEVSIHKKGWEQEKRPFTFTSLNDWPFLEFTIKSYQHGGVTQELGTLQAGDELIIRDVWGAIAYQGEGYFIAGGAGITPFIAILRQLKKENRLAGNALFFSNKTEADIILKQELDEMLGKQVHHILTEGTHQFIDKAYLQSNVTDFSKQFYICGPDPMVAAITGIVTELGANANAVVFEK